MTTSRHIVFLFNLLQDVNILRPLAYLAAREFDARLLFLVSSSFLKRDSARSWQREIAEIGVDVGAAIHIYETPLDAFAILQGKGGVLLAGSESSLSAHAETHQVFRTAPASFLTVTLQHGYECVGFLHSREHDIAHGRHVTFAAQVLCAWSAPSALRSLAYSERPKVFETGPSTILHAMRHLPDDHPPGGLVCENLHSVRLRASGQFGPRFMETFQAFCKCLQEYGNPVNLRPHPGGQYVLKNAVSVPENVIINNLPIYKVPLSSFAYGISAPSSVLIDLALAGIPTAVWRDQAGVMDADNYAGLTEIGGLDDWLAFARDAALRPEVALDRQRNFLDHLAMISDKTTVYRRFARLLGATSEGIRVSQVSSPAREYKQSRPGLLGRLAQPLGSQ